MRIHTLLKRGFSHKDFCEDFLLCKALDEKYLLAGVFDGCSSGVDSHFASALFAKIVKNVATELYSKAQTESPNYKTYKSVISSRVESLLLRKSGDEYFSENDQEYNYKDVVWCYSFWVRRHQENNMEAVYKILKDIDNTLR